MAKVRMKQKARSRSIRKIYKKSPGGKLKVRTKRRKKGKKNTCEICGIEIKRMRKNHRVFGGILCGKCLSRVISFYARVNEGLPIERVDLRYRKYVRKFIGKNK